MGRLLTLIGALGMLIAAGQLYAGGRGTPVALAKQGSLMSPPRPEAR